MQKRLVIGGGVKVLDQKSQGGGEGSVNYPASLRVKERDRVCLLQSDRYCYCSQCEFRTSKLHQTKDIVHLKLFV